MAKTILEVKNLKKYFKTPKGMLHAVDDVNFTIEEGKTLGVVGESGCGKSTTGRAILRLHEPTSGEVIFNGENILTKNADEMRLLRRQMQLIFQDPYASLDPRNTVSEIIGEPLKLQKLIPDKKERLDKVYELMETVGLAERLVNTYPHELDGGRRQRIGIARALAMEPKFIVCDEPVSALDVSIQAQILNLMQDLQEKMGLTYMFITHDLSVVHHFADDIAVMYAGKIVEYGTADDIFYDPRHPYTWALLSSMPDLDTKEKLDAIPGTPPNMIYPPVGDAFADRNKYAMQIDFEMQPPMFEISETHRAATWLLHPDAPKVDIPKTITDRIERMKAKSGGAE